MSCLLDFLKCPAKCKTILNQFIYSTGLPLIPYIKKIQTTLPRCVLWRRGPWTVSALMTLQGQTLNNQRFLSSCNLLVVSNTDKYACTNARMWRFSHAVLMLSGSWCRKSPFSTDSSGWWMDWGWIRRPVASSPRFTLNRYKLGMKGLTLCHRRGSRSASFFLSHTVEPIACAKLLFRLILGI